jgi:hypothetical protein
VVPHSVAALESSTARTGILRGLTAAGVPMVVFADSGTGDPVEAQSCVPLGARDVGCDVVLLCTADRPERPIVLGVIRPTATTNPVQVTADGKSITLVAQESITLECGESRITLHRSGKVVIRGAHVVSHSTGVNRIRGGSVELN